MHIFKKNGFTLAEILITLGIIGVVAAMTIPSLMNNVRAIKLRSQFNKAHAELVLAYKLMADNESVAPNDYYRYATNNYFYKQFIKYFKSGFDCGTNSLGMNKNLPCYSKDGVPYKTLDGKNTVHTGWIDDGQIGLMDGALILIENNLDALWLSVDINGYNNGPNQWGVDLFTFQVTDDGLLPMGNTATTYNNLNTYCNSTQTNEYNGIACAEKAIKDVNYFKDLYKKK